MHRLSTPGAERPIVITLWNMASNAETAEGNGTVYPVTVVTESNLPDGARETVVSNSTRRSTSSVSEGSRTQHFEGRPTQNEENVADALHRLRDALNQAAGSGVWKEHTCDDSCDHDVAVDGVLLSSDGQEIECQVTRVERDTLRIRGHEGEATSNNDDETLVSNVVAAIESKKLSADPKMFLVLDANDAPAYTDESNMGELVREGLARREHLGRWAKVWLVEPTVARTTCIDPS
jgi:hypothetical protein